MKRIFTMGVMCLALAFCIACGIGSGVELKDNEVIQKEYQRSDKETKEESATVELEELSVKQEVDVQETDIKDSSVFESISVEESILEVHYIDVGEADSALVICDGEAMLVDTGNPDQGTKIRLYLKQHGVSKLKYLLLTHSDRDHIGGAASVVSNVDIDNLFMCRYEKDNDVYNNLINEIDYKNMSWSTPNVGSVFDLGSSSITIIAPNRIYDNPNDSSIAFIVKHGGNSFIFTGDAEVAAENDIVNNGMDISADVYYVGHHGSHTSSTQDFLNKVLPKYAVISCAKDNQYGHPHVETMEKLYAMGVQLYRTDDQGTIICYSDGSNISFNVEPSNNWSNGNSDNNSSASTLVKEAFAEATRAVDEEKNIDDNLVNIEQEVSTQTTYVLNNNSKKFHEPSCDSVNDMSLKNRQDVNWSREEVINLGYQPCKRCNP